MSAETYYKVVVVRVEQKQSPGGLAFMGRPTQIPIKVLDVRTRKDPTMIVSKALEGIKYADTKI